MLNNRAKDKTMIWGYLKMKQPIAGILYRLAIEMSLKVADFAINFKPFQLSTGINHCNFKISLKAHLEKQLVLIEAQKACSNLKMNLEL